MSECLGGLAAIGVMLWILVAVATASENRRRARLAKELAAQEQIVRDTVARLRQQIHTFLKSNPRYTTGLHQVASRSIYRDEFGDLDRKEWHKSLRKFAAEKMGMDGQFTLKAKDYPQELISSSTRFSTHSGSVRACPIRATSHRHVWERMVTGTTV